MFGPICEGEAMRINRTFSIPYDLAQDLKKKHNQSETVTRALRKYLDGDAVDVRDIPTKQLLVAVRTRYDQFDTEYQLLTTVISLLS